jgi:hypothetical protein
MQKTKITPGCRVAKLERLTRTGIVDSAGYLVRCWTQKFSKEKPTKKGRILVNNITNRLICTRQDFTLSQGLGGLMREYFHDYEVGRRRALVKN